MSSFSAQINAWVAETKERADAVFRESSQRIISDMQRPVGAGGNMPVDTGFLRASLQVTKGSPAPMSRANPGGANYSYPGIPALVIAGANMGDTIYATYTANYAAHVNYGTSKMQGRQFVGLAAQKWTNIVAKVSAELQGSSS